MPRKRNNSRAKRKSKMDKDSWFVRHARKFTKSVEVLFGLIFVFDAYAKIGPGNAFINNFSALVARLAVTAPSWSQPWYHLWIGLAVAHPAACVYTIIILEFALGFALILGFMRKIAYLGGVVYSMFLWTVPEGFGFSYLGGPTQTNIGVGIVYAIAFLLLVALDAAHRDNYYTLDLWIENRMKWWRKLAEFGK